MKSSHVLAKLQARLYEQRVLSIRLGEPDSLPGFLDKMIVPTSLDAYITPVRRGLTGKDVIDFRNKYRPLQDRNRAKDPVSYDSRNREEQSKHSRRLLLSAECQIGKTGAYLALLQHLQQTLQPMVAVALPDFDAVIPPSPADDSDIPDELGDSEVVVDGNRSLTAPCFIQRINHMICTCFCKMAKVFALCHLDDNCTVSC